MSSAEYETSFGLFKKGKLGYEADRHNEVHRDKQFLERMNSD